ncbi:MAG: indolepyruvate ferredoxin oxidoreductase subunit alpha [Candidatus Thorarchaeota archaeon]
MIIKEDLCIGCGNCVILCTVNAIKIIDDKAVINQDLCVECSVCYRYADCPVNAIKPKHLKWPRIVRNPFSDVISTHKITGVPGRGTEEMKTNDVTNRFKSNEIGFSIEIGRPGVGTALNNINLFIKKLSKIDVHYEEMSPVTALLNDKRTSINEEVKDERVLSAIIEFKVKIDKVDDVLKVIEDVDKVIDTVFSVGIIYRVSDGNKYPIKNLIEKRGFSISPNAKVNIGLGRI